MPCLIRRYHVTNIMVFLIVMMILVNVYALGVFLSRQPMFDSNSALYNSRTKDAEVVVDDSITSVRFLVNHNGTVRLVSPRALSTVETNSMVVAIMRKFHQMRLEPIAPVQGYIRFVNRIKRALSYSPSRKTQDPSFLWSRAGEWPFQLDNYKFQNMGDILRFTNKAEILEAKNSRRGTQLKVEVLLDGGQVALFKPSWYPGGTVINGNVYGGKDRHFGEIAAFYLNQLLGYYNGPITVGRRVNVANEIMANADDKLRNTFFRDPGGNFCFYGVCYYCSKNDSVCAHGENIDGALILLLNKKIRIVANPWRRTYKENIYAEWQTEPGYCSSLLRNGSSKKRLEVILDIVSVAIFDFIIGNGDRHHFEMYTDADAQLALPTHSKSILLIDNGKSFGNPYEDYIDILSPLYQCCKIRQSLLRTLKKFNGVLGKALDSLSSVDPLYPLLDDRHLQSIDRRLEIVLAAVEVCLSRFSGEDVII